MAPLDVQAGITSALSGRRAQREFVDQLAVSWQQFMARFAALTVSAVEAAPKLASLAGPNGDQAKVAAELVEYLREDTSGWHAARQLTAQIEKASSGVDAVHRRVGRDTVNIGVIGMTKAGKSTLLRRLTELPEAVIPTSQYASTTAAPSRIFHRSGSGGAILTLHTWESFRRTFLEPLHARAELPPAPHTLADFSRVSYPEPNPSEQAGVKRYRNRLRQARASLPSYENLLRGGTLQIPLDEQLRPFVAYPADDDPQPNVRPYHAVRAVDIYCEFPEVGAVGLGLVDLPGAGEAGLDVHRQFLSDLRNEVDLLFILKRPEKTSAMVTNRDWDVVELADEAAGGVRRSDFIHYIVNRDQQIPAEFLDRGAAEARQEASRLGFDVQECDIAASPNVRGEILAPTLERLAGRLADMDRDAVRHVLAEASKVAGQASTLARDLTHRLEGWQARRPDEQERLRRLARELKNEISVALRDVLNRYDDLGRAGEPVAELDGDITTAVRKIQEWERGGFGAGSTEEWLRKVHAAISAKETGRELDRQYNNARQVVSDVFGEIDASLTRSVNQLWDEIASVLRAKLTDRLVPTGPDALAEFAATARQHGLETLSEATDRLLALHTDYGSIFLRVGRPIVREIYWERSEQRSGQDPLVQVGAAVIGGAVGGPIGHAVGAAAGPVAGAAVGGAASAAVREGIKWWEGGPAAQSAAPSPAPKPRQRQDPAPPADDEKGGSYPDAWSRHSQLCSVLHRVTDELESGLRAEARRTVKVLAAAADQFVDTTISTPDVEGQFAKLCQPVQLDIWPDEFAGAVAQLTAEMGSLLEQARDANIAAERIIALAEQARRL